MLSLFENTNSPVTVHILHDDTLTDDNRDKFIYLAGRYSQAVKFYNVEKICPDKLSAFVELTPEIKNTHVSVGTLYRLLVPQIILSDIEKIIYLDSDLIVNLDIKELWQIDLDEKIFFLFLPNFPFNVLEEAGFVRGEDFFDGFDFLTNESDAYSFAKAM